MKMKSVLRVSVASLYKVKTLGERKGKRIENEIVMIEEGENF